MTTKINDIMPVTLRYKFIKNDDVFLCQGCYKNTKAEDVYVAIVELKGGHTAERYICKECAEEKYFKKEK